MINKKKKYYRKNITILFLFLPVYVENIQRLLQNTEICHDEMKTVKYAF